MSVLKKLMQARIKLQNTEIKKSGKNKFAGYTYFELSDFLPATQKIFADLGLAGIVSYAADTATLTITCTEDGDCITIASPMATAALKGCHDVQNLGAVQTYLRRYLWVTAMELVDHSPLDGEGNNTEPKTTTLPKCSDEKFDSLKDEWEKLVRNGKPSDDLINALSTKTILSKEQIATIKSWEAKHETAGA